MSRSKKKWIREFRLHYGCLPESTGTDKGISDIRKRNKIEYEKQCLKYPNAKYSLEGSVKIPFKILGDESWSLGFDFSKK